MKKIILLLVVILNSLFVNAGLFDKTSRFLKAEDAFQFSAIQEDQYVNLHWRIADNYYLYKKEIKIDTENAQLATVSFPKAELHQDEFFGETEVYRQALILNIPLVKANENAKLMVSYQGCTEGFCYPPVVQEIPLTEIMTNIKTDEKTTALDNSNNQNQLSQLLFKSKFAVFWFFLLGLGLAFTPCVLPMLPLLSALVIGGNQRPSTLKALLLSFTYVQGMALTYTLLGLVVAAIGLPFQVALQSPPVLISLSIVFVLLALSMFGLFTLQLPSGLQTKLTALSSKQKSGAFFGVFVMGMVAGLVASPCTSAPLSGALLYVAQTGDLFIGAVTLYLLALGMGIPLILITVFGNKVLPKSGMWMEKVKVTFGFVMLALPIFLVSRLIPEIWENALWSLLGVTFCLWFAYQINSEKWGLLLKIGLLVIALIIVKPLQDLVWHSDRSISSESAVQNSSVLSSHFQLVSSYAELQEKLMANPKSVAMLDLYADWCVACKEFEKYTFADTKVSEAFKSILLLQVDMTKNSDKNKELTEKLGVIGLPTIIFFDQQGNEIPHSRINGFMPADEFLNWLKEKVNL
ncbi:thiol:disulfide interchange protein DsbD [Bisgaardia hudsonensis]|uniref:Thiol:disulfide interchange protein DsbD n=1 Tax=Bisgaardia hudsonensis TaxID=109472 RepID=A0A4R2N0D7_9PAST|nr:protein-disulfide reductase DsbD [Bisgaardia hudsonensis]QLB13447.1 protein-disulfide reductase DsbD [Bisgaardia hudsonensis]TCP12856.1 thiol:disulfide interchange protein DsbD [Bisgaardia hudsonensis]